MLYLSERGNFKLFGLVYQLYLRKFELFGARLLKKREYNAETIENLWCKYPVFLNSKLSSRNPLFRVQGLGFRYCILHLLFSLNPRPETLTAASRFKEELGQFFSEEGV